MFDALKNFLGTAVLYLVAWYALAISIYCIKERFFKRVDDWFTGPIIAMVLATLAIGGLFIYNHISFIL